MPLNLDLPRARGLFITATDTEVGKTLVSGAIASLLSRKYRVGVFKPIATGCIQTREGLVSEDAQFLSLAADGDIPLSTITPVRYSIPAAPVVSAEYENRPIDYDAIRTAYRYIAENHDIVIVEGIGGALVPIDEQFTILDLAQQFALPAVVVARPNLGTINHSLMTLACVRAAGLRVVGVVLNGYRETEYEIAEQTAPRVISGFGQTNILTCVPWDEQSSVENGTLGPDLLEAVADCDWEDLINEFNP